MSVCRYNSSELPLVPSTLLLPPLQRPRRWTLTQTGRGTRWQPSDAMVTSQEAREQGWSRPYTNEEYLQYLQVEGWSQEETDYLLELCHRFNYRFIIVKAHYEYASETQRSIEDIKERYFWVTDRLASIRRESQAGGMLHSYDKEADRLYRLSLESMEGRPIETQREEALLSQMMSEMRLCLPRVLQERERLLLLCGGLGQHLLAHAPSLPDLAGGSTHFKTKKSLDANARSSKGEANSNRKRQRSASSSRSRTAASEADHEIYDEKTPKSGGAAIGAGPGHKPKLEHGNTVLRSSMLRPIKIGLTRQVDKLLAEFGLGTFQLLFMLINYQSCNIGIKPNISTDAVCEKYDQLRALLVRLVELQRTVAQINGSAPSTPGTASRPDSSSSRRPSRPASPLIDQVRKPSGQFIHHPLFIDIGAQHAVSFKQAKR